MIIGGDCEAIHRIGQTLHKLIQPILSLGPIFTDGQTFCPDEAKIGVFAQGVCGQTNVLRSCRYFEIELLWHLDDLDSFNLLVQPHCSLGVLGAPRLRGNPLFQ